jgi:hypothetical protein
LATLVRSSSFFSISIVAFIFIEENSVVAGGQVLSRRVGHGGIIKCDLEVEFWAAFFATEPWSSTSAGVVRRTAATLSLHHMLVLKPMLHLYSTVLLAVIASNAVAVLLAVALALNGRKHDQ